MIPLCICLIVLTCLWIPAAAQSSQFHDDPINHAFLQQLQHTPEYIPPTTSTSTPWSHHASLASYLDTTSINVVDVPIPIYLYVVGLDGTGSLAVNLSRPQLHTWLSHLPHSHQHSIVTDMINATAHDGDGDAATIRYRYHYHIIQLSPMITDVIERVVATHHRKLEVAGETTSTSTSTSTTEHKSMVQVDADRMHSVLESLIKHLQLDQEGYHLFILNPKLTSYGYRSGFSNAEIDRILQVNGVETDGGLRSALASYASNLIEANKLASAMKNNEEIDKINVVQETFETQKQKKKQVKWEDVEFIDRIEDSKMWAASYLAQPYKEGPMSLSDYFNSLAADYPGSISKQILKRTVGNQFAQQDALVDAWVGSSLLVWLDLAAGPFEWGPSIHGEGVRTKHTFPTIIGTFQLAAQNWVTTETDEQLSAEAEEAAADGDSLEAVQAEMILIEDKWHVAKCDEQEQMDTLCTSLMNQLSELQKYAEDLSAKSKKRGPKEERVSQGIDPSSFSFIHAGGDATEERALGQKAGVGGGIEESKVISHLEQLETDHFMAHLSSSLQSVLSHVITPAMADVDPIEGGYYSRVAFHLYILSNHQMYDPLSDELVERFRNTIEQLRVPSQEFSVQLHSLNMDDDPTLAMAYTSSLRSTVVPSINSAGHFASFKRLYLDSRRLQAELTRLGVDRQSAQLEHSKGARDIPIFLFSLNHPLPVFVDKHYQSRALNNMVISVQSALHLWESPVKCNGRPIYWNLRDPVRSMVLSAAQLLGGLLPIHLTHSRALNRTAQDWSWSVGTSPASATSTSGMTFSQIQRDAIHRNYVIHAIRRSSSIVNAAIHTLRRYSTNLIPFSVTTRFGTSFTQIQQHYQKYQQALQELSIVFETREWHAWCPILPKLIQQAQTFAQSINSTLTSITGWRCSQDDSPIDVPIITNIHTPLPRTEAAHTAITSPSPSSLSSSSPVPRVASLLSWFRRHSLGSMYFAMFAIASLLLVLRRVIYKTPVKPKLN